MQAFNVFYQIYPYSLSSNSSTIFNSSPTTSTLPSQFHVPFLKHTESRYVQGCRAIPWSVGVLSVTISMKNTDCPPPSCHRVPMAPLLLGLSVPPPPIPALSFH